MIPAKHASHHLIKRVLTIGACIAPILLLLSACSDYPSWDLMPDDSTLSKEVQSQQNTIDSLTQDYDTHQIKQKHHKKDRHNKGSQISTATSDTQDTNQDTQARDNTPMDASTMPPGFNQTTFLFNALFISNHDITPPQEEILKDLANRFFLLNAKKIKLYFTKTSPHIGDIPPKTVEHIKQILIKNGLPQNNIEIMPHTSLVPTTKKYRWAVDLYLVY